MFDNFDNKSLRGDSATSKKDMASVKTPQKFSAENFEDKAKMLQHFCGLGGGHILLTCCAYHLYSKIPSKSTS